MLLLGHPPGEETSGGERLLVDPVTGREGESSSSYRHFISDLWLSHPTPFLENVAKRTAPGGRERPTAERPSLRILRPSMC